MYHPFFQFVLPRLGPGGAGCFAVPELFAAAALTAGGPVAGAVLRTAACADGRCWRISAATRSGLGIVFAGHLVTFYCIGTAIGLALRRVGGAPLTVWHIFWLGGITPWLLTGPYHVVGAAAGAAAVYDKIQPDNAEKPCPMVRLTYRTDQRRTPPGLRGHGPHPHPGTAGRKSRPASRICWC